MSARYTIVTLLLAVAIVSMVVHAVVSEATSDPTIQGDADCNSRVDTADALLILGFAAQPVPVGDCVPSDGNVNCDGTINALDALLVVRYEADLSAYTKQGCPEIGQARAEPSSTPAETKQETATPTPTPTPTPVLTPSAVPSPTASVVDNGSGIDGLVEEGPMCPVERQDSPCPDRPVAGAPIRISPVAGGAVTTVESDNEGRFHVAEAPGDYDVEPLPINDSWWPRPGAAQRVSVEDGRFVHVTVKYDTGIR